MTASDTSPRTPTFVSVKAAAATLALPPYTVLELCEAGLIASRHDDGRVMVDADSVTNYATRLA